MLAGLLAVVAAIVPIGGLVWWLANPDGHALTREEPAVVPAYMEQSSLLGDEHGVLVLRGSVDDGIDYRVRRGDGVTLGEDEVLALADEDVDLTRQVTELVSAPTGELVESLARAGIEYVVLPSPADGTIAAASTPPPAWCRPVPRTGPPGPGASTGRCPPRGSRGARPGRDSCCWSCRSPPSCSSSSWPRPP